MILHYLSESAERTLRTAYVNSDVYDDRKYSGYSEYVMKIVPGVVETLYTGGDNHNWMEALLFETDEHLSWFLLRWG